MNLSPYFSVVRNNKHICMISLQCVCIETVLGGRRASTMDILSIYIEADQSRLVNELDD